MTLLARLDARFPRFAFARHVPPRRIAVRVLRRVQARFAFAGPARPGDARLRAPEVLPGPVFAPRPIAAAREGDGWRFTFLADTRRFANGIDWTPDREPAHQLWRMNLHYMEYLEVLPPRDGADAILSWIAANPPTRPGAHHDAWNAYALSLRAVCWLQWLARDGAVLTDAERDTMAASLAAQLNWLAARPETDLGGNHLVKNIKALLWGGAAFQGAAARRWTTLGRRLLADELPAQVLRDGVHYERSPAYHNQVAADLIECHAVLRRHAAIRLDARLDAMVRAALALRHPDGAPAQFGDAGLTMAYPADQLAAAWAAEGGRVETAPQAVLRDGGFAAFHSDGFTAILKCGPVGADSLPAHAHGDVGAIELSWRDARLVVDQGVYEYVDGPRRRASRAAAGHNLTAADGADMADFFGAFRLGRRPRVELERAASGSDDLTVTVGHDGFAPATVRRTARLSAAAVEIEDRIAGGGAMTWTSRFLLHPDWAAAASADGILLTRGPERLRFVADAPARLVEAVWWPDMGVERATRRIEIAWPAGSDRLAMRFIAD